MGIKVNSRKVLGAVLKNAGVPDRVANSQTVTRMARTADRWRFFRTGRTARQEERQSDQTENRTNFSWEDFGWEECGKMPGFGTYMSIVNCIYSELTGLQSVVLFHSIPRQDPFLKIMATARINRHPSKSVAFKYHYWIYMTLVEKLINDLYIGH